MVQGITVLRELIHHFALSILKFRFLNENQINTRSVDQNYSEKQLIQYSQLLYNEFKTVYTSMCLFMSRLNSWANSDRLCVMYDYVALLK